MADDFRSITARQHGLITREQLRTAGLSPAKIAWLVERGEYHPVSRRVLRGSQSRRTREQRWMEAVLDVGPGSALSHASAALLWGLPRSSREAIHVTVERDRRQTHTGIAVSHRPRCLPDRLITRLDDIPVVRPELLVLQTCATAPHLAERTLDGLWSKRLLSGPSTRRCLEELARSGRTGIVLLRELLDARGPDYVPPSTGLEARFQEIMRGACITTMVRQVDLGDDEHWVGRVDFVERSIGHIVEVDSERYHSALSDLESDRRRQLALEQAGFTVSRVTDLEVWHHPNDVVRRVREGRERARAAQTLRHHRSGLDARRLSRSDPTQNALETGQV